MCGWVRERVISSVTSAVFQKLRWWCDYCPVSHRLNNGTPLSLDLIEQSRRGRGRESEREWEGEREGGRERERESERER